MNVDPHAEPFSDPHAEPSGNPHAGPDLDLRPDARADRRPNTQPQAPARHPAEEDASAIRPLGVLFDLDGTLVDSVGDLAQASNNMLAALSLSSLHIDQIRTFIGQGVDHLITRCLECAGNLDRASNVERAGNVEDADSVECAGNRGSAGDVSHVGNAERVGITAQRHAAARAEFDRAYAACNGRQTTVFDGVVAALQRLRAANIRTAVVTNKADQFVGPLLESVGLAGLIQTWVGGDSVAHRKPHPAPLLEVSRRWNLPPERLAFVGDSVHDAHAARSAGMQCWLVSYGYPNGPTAATLVAEGQADGIVDSVDQLARRWTASQ